jgi:uncharacterized membrane protein HdeD (DUF308 family)
MLSSLIERYWWIPLLRGIVAILFGVVALTRPGITLASLVLFFGVLLMVDGLFTIYHAIQGRRETTRWWVMLLEGLLALVLSACPPAAPGMARARALFFIAPGPS